VGNRSGVIGAAVADDDTNTMLINRPAADLQKVLICHLPGFLRRRLEHDKGSAQNESRAGNRRVMRIASIRGPRAAM
jgi:hypothetical protein